MRHSVIALSAVACISLGLPDTAKSADLPIKAAPAPAAVVEYNWSGLYIGGHAGYGWGRGTWTNISGLFLDPQVRHDMDGALGGGQIGFNYQVGRWVFGVEGDFSATGIDGTGIFDPNVGVDPVSIRSEWLATAAGRLGYAHGAWLVYVKGGGAWVDNRYRVTITPLAGSPTAEINDVRSGYVIGGGVEYGFLGNWSVRAEYNYYDFGTARLSFPPVPGFAGLPNFPLDVDQHIHAIKFALNYRFGWR
jgi:opacity protein-like surface antigen